MKKFLGLFLVMLGFAGVTSFAADLSSLEMDQAGRTFKCGNGHTYWVPGEGKYVDYASYWVGVALEDGPIKYCVLCCNEFDDVEETCVFNTRENARDYALVHCKSQGTPVN